MGAETWEEIADRLLNEQGPVLAGAESISALVEEIDPHMPADCDLYFAVPLGRVLVFWPMRLHVHGQSCVRA